MKGSTHGEIRRHSVILAIVFLLALLYVGIATPGRVEEMEVSGPELEYGWPSNGFAYIHWVWTIPAGFLVALFVVAKDKRLPIAQSSTVNVAVLALLVLLGALWWYGNTITAMIQIVYQHDNIAEQNGPGELAFTATI